MWEEIKSVSVVLFCSCTGCSAPSIILSQGSTRAGFLSNSSLPCMVLVEGKEKRKGIKRLKIK